MFRAVVLAAAALVLGSVTAASAAPARQPAWHSHHVFAPALENYTPTQFNAIGTGSTNPMEGASTVSCGTSSCVAIGDGYHGQALAVLYSRGKWSRYAEIPPPARAGAGATLGIQQVACTGRSACTAVGFLQPKRKAEQVAVASRP